MEKCQFCDAELPEGVTLCPGCGKENAPAEEMPVQEVINPEEIPTEDAQAEEAPVKKEKKPASKLEIAILVALVAVLIALVTVLISQHSGKKADTAETTEAPVVEYTIPADGNPDDITCKGTYTVTDEELAKSRDTVVATCGDAQLTVGQLQTYYWMEVRSFLNAYGAYAAYFGMDTAQSLDKQPCGVAEGVTWQQYFLESSLNAWQNYQAMAFEAAENQAEMNPEFQEIIESLDADLEQAAQSGGFDSVEDMLAKTMGPGATAAEYKNYMQVYYAGFSYYDVWAKENAPTAQEIEDFFAEREDEYADNGITKETATIDVRHILIMPEETTDDQGNTSVSDEARSAAQTKAEDILKQWKAGDLSEESFAALATEYTEDPGSQSTGGLYEGVTEGQMVPAFNDWCFDASRKPGDYGIVQTDYGFHVMYFVARNLMWESYAKSDLTNERTEDFVLGVSAKHPITVDYSKLMLGDLALS